MTLNHKSKKNFFGILMNSFCYAFYHRIGTAGVVCRIKDLFKYFPELLVGFNAFMPMDNKIEPIQCSDGQSFFTVKADFLSDSTVNGYIFEENFLYF